MLTRLGVAGTLVTLEQFVKKNCERKKGEVEDRLEYCIEKKSEQHTVEVPVNMCTRSAELTRSASNIIYFTPLPSPFKRGQLNPTNVGPKRLCIRPLVPCQFRDICMLVSIQLKIPHQPDIDRGCVLLINDSYFKLGFMSDISERLTPTLRHCTIPL